MGGAPMMGGMPPQMPGMGGGMGGMDPLMMLMSQPDAPSEQALADLIASILNPGSMGMMGAQPGQGEGSAMLQALMGGGGGMSSLSMMQ